MRGLWQIFACSLLDHFLQELLLSLIYKKKKVFFSLVSFLRIIAAYKPQIELKNLLLVMTFKNLFKASNIGEIVP